MMMMIMMVRMRMVIRLLMMMMMMMMRMMRMMIMIMMMMIRKKKKVNSFRAQITYSNSGTTVNVFRAKSAVFHDRLPRNVIIIKNVIIIYSFLKLIIGNVEAYDFYEKVKKRKKRSSS